MNFMKQLSTINGNNKTSTKHRISLLMTLINSSTTNPVKMTHSTCSNAHIGVTNDVNNNRNRLNTTILWSGLATGENTGQMKRNIAYRG